MRHLPRKTGLASLGICGEFAWATPGLQGPYCLIHLGCIALASSIWSTGTACTSTAAWLLSTRTKTTLLTKRHGQGCLMLSEFASRWELSDLQCREETAPLRPRGEINPDIKGHKSFGRRVIEPASNLEVKVDARLNIRSEVLVTVSLFQKPVLVCPTEFGGQRDDLC